MNEMTNTTDHAELIAAAHAQVGHIADMSNRERLIADLAAALEKAEQKLAEQAATIEAVKMLHVPARRYQVLGVDERSFDSAEEAATSAEEAAEWLDDDVGGVTYFEVCAECGRVESGQLREYGDEWSYRESLWPCRTATILASMDTTGRSK